MRRCHHGCIGGVQIIAQVLGNAITIVIIAIGGCSASYEVTLTLRTTASLNACEVREMCERALLLALQGTVALCV